MTVASPNAFPIGSDPSGSGSSVVFNRAPRSQGIDGLLAVCESDPSSVSDSTAAALQRWASLRSTPPETSARIAQLLANRRKDAP